MQFAYENVKVISYKHGAMSAHGSGHIAFWGGLVGALWPRIQSAGSQLTSDTLASATVQDSDYVQAVQ